MLDEFTLELDFLLASGTPARLNAFVDEVVAEYGWSGFAAM